MRETSSYSDTDEICINTRNTTHTFETQQQAMPAGLLATRVQRTKRLWGLGLLRPISL